VYKSNEGFLAQYCVTDIRQSFSWRDLVQFAEDVLVFSQPLNNSCRYNMLFLDKSSVQLLQFVYRGMAREMFGDVFASSALALAYTQKMLALAECDLEVESHRELLLEFNETDQSHRFFECFDTMCRCNFEKAILCFNDYSKLFIDMACVDVYVDLAERCMPRLWAHLCNLRNVTAGKQMTRFILANDKFCHRFLHCVV